MANQWIPSTWSSTTSITGTNCNIAKVTISGVAYDPVLNYSNNGYYAASVTGVVGITPYSSAWGTICMRFAISPTKTIKSVTIPLTHKTSGNGYSTSQVKYYAKTSTSATAWPAVSDTSSTQFSVTAAGTTDLTISVSPTSSPFFVYLWGYKVNYDYNTEHSIQITKIGAPTGTLATYTVTLSPASGVTYSKTSPQTVTAGAAFSFTVTIGDTYMANSSFAVKAGSTTLTASSHSGKTYSYSVAINANTTITVTGVVLGGVVRIGSGSAWVNYQVYIGTGSGWVQYLPYIGTGSGWQLYS